MPFVKVIKNKAYFKRFQVKYRRRREGKTDYRARKRLITQDKNKYNTPKYRLVVRFTNRHCICQIVYSQIVGDKVVVQANSAELARYGLSVGLKNYAAAYCTGLLVARRLLQQVKLDEVYKGQLTYGNSDEEGSDEEDEYLPNVVSTEYNKRTYYVEELDDDKNPFHAILDVGVISTTTGSRVFGALKGATDGGLDIPYSEKRFPGFDRDTKEYDAEVHKERIFGEHVAEYMRYLKDEDGAKFKSQFKEYIAAGHDADDLEELYQDVHKAIREDPSPAEKKEWDDDRVTYKRKGKKTLKQRKADIEVKRAQFMPMEDDDDEED